jgi:hypothetical protein
VALVDKAVNELYNRWICKARDFSVLLAVPTYGELNSIDCDWRNDSAKPRTIPESGIDHRREAIKVATGL